MDRNLCAGSGGVKDGHSAPGTTEVVEAGNAQGHLRDVMLWLELTPFNGHPISCDRKALTHCRDNPTCESFFATVECEPLDLERFRPHSEARVKIFDFVEGCSTRTGGTLPLGYCSPAPFERSHPRATT
jgi:hypothetical protein